MEQALIDIKMQLIKDAETIQDGFKTVKHFRKVKPTTLKTIKESVHQTKIAMKTVKLNRNIVGHEIADEILELGLANIKQYRLLYAKVATS